MKQSDIAMLVLIVSFSLIGSYFIGNAVFVKDDTRSVKVKVTQPISVEFPAPDEKIFNSQAVNLTEKITIGGSKSETPFTSNSN